MARMEKKLPTRIFHVPSRKKYHLKVMAFIQGSGGGREGVGENKALIGPYSGQGHIWAFPLILHDTCLAQ